MPVPSKPFTFSDTPSGTNLIKAAEINANYDALYNTLNPASIGVDDSNVKAAGLTDAVLASPTSPAWRTVMEQMYQGGISGLTTTPSYVGGTTGTAASGTSSGALSGLWVPPVAADVAVAGKTTRLRIRVSWASNSTAATITFTFGLYPITAIGGGAAAIQPTLGAVIAGSTVAVVAPPTNQIGSATGTSFDFSLLSSSVGYLIGCVGSGTQAANSFLAPMALLEMRHT